MQPDWEIWTDANISPIIAKWLAEHLNMPVRSSYTLGLTGMLDQEIYDLAQKTGNIILLSKDSDFSELISRLGFPPKLILLNIGNAGNQRLWDWMQPNIHEAVRILSTTDVGIIVLE